ncbi:hypothetical protein [Spirosoma pulveris]
MKKQLITYLLLAVSLVGLDGCKKKPNSDPNPDRLVGQPGNPRFNLQFTNQAGADLDLHVIEPSGAELYWNNSYSRTNGQLDVDCNCSDCGQGPNENIFWPDGQGPKGTYKVWVEHFEKCGSASSSASSYTLRIVVNEVVKQTYTGTLSGSNQKSQVWTWVQN